jgi:hypothetical protein
MSEIVIRPVANKADLKAFIRLPFDLYQGDPNWVPQLNSDVAETLSAEKNPFFQHAEREFFLAELKGKPVGRIAAVIDRNYIAHHKENCGFFGFFETENNYEVAVALFDQARSWLRAKGMTKMRGPGNPSLNDEAGMLYEGFDSPPVVKMTYNPPFYMDFCNRYGMTKAKDYYAYYARIPDKAPEKMTRVMERLKKRAGITVRQLDPKHLDREVKLIKEVYNDAWSRNWDFSPMTEAEIDDMARKLKMLIVPEIVPCVEINGEVAGVAVSLPDYNQVLKSMGGKLNVIKFLLNRGKIDGFRLWALGVKYEFHMYGLDSLLYYETLMGAHKKGYKWCEVSWILEDNVSIIRPIEMWGCKLYKKYRIFENPV